MSMSIGQLIKGLVGEAQAGDGKAMELKVGQTVRGVLVKMTGDQEGIVQINGTPVLAKLETALEPGQATLLQVQPDSGDGALVLKQADPKSAAAAEASVKEWIKALGLPDTKASAELVGELRKDGVVLTRELASQFRAALAAMPEGGDAQSWMRAAALVFRRGLPMTGATIGALQQVLAGPPAHALLDALEAGLAAWSGSAAGQGAGGSAQPPGAAQAAAAKLQALLAEGAALMREAQAGAGGAEPPAGGAAGAGGAGAERAPQGAAGAAAAARSASAALEAGAGKGASAAGTAVGSAVAPQVTGGAPHLQGLPQRSEAAAMTEAAPHAGEAAQLGSAFQASGASPSGRAPAGATLQAAGEAAPESAGQAGSAAASQLSGRAQSAAAMQPNSPALSGKQEQGSSSMEAATGNMRPAGADGTPPASQASTGSSWVGQLMKWLGVDHERLLATSTILQSRQSHSEGTASDQLAVPDNKMDAAKSAVIHTSTPTGQERTAPIFPDHSPQQAQAIVLAAALQNHVAQAGEEVKPNAAETLKSALMTIAASDDVPQQLRDTAQQLVSHITGQQLLLSPEKNGALFSHVTLFIPMKGPDGSGTASVHIQARRGRRGELDGDNCRLLFDLRMKTLGETVVDVQVVNKIVNLHVWNDHPATAQLVDASRSELTGALAAAGYQLLTLRAEPIPERLVERLNGTEGLAAVAEGQVWSTKPYKGVDVRI